MKRVAAVYQRLREHSSKPRYAQKLKIGSVYPDMWTTAGLEVKIESRAERYAGDGDLRM